MYVDLFLEEVAKIKPLSSRGLSVRRRASTNFLHSSRSVPPGRRPSKLYFLFLVLAVHMIFGNLTKSGKLSVAK